MVSQGAGQATQRAAGLMKQFEDLPASVYYWGALGAIGLSGLLMLFGKRNVSLFVGLWPPTIALLGLFNKMLTPSREVATSDSLMGMNSEDLKDTAGQMAGSAREMANTPEAS